ncbi:relaxase/mobilization nuclease domain-containing protein [Clostridium sp. VAP23]|uniref:relaxase/mobilization nuclease domain-containing protein n=1 Tax=Clostridium sp. VAP23 TaxID=2949981 RepID=UPI002079C94D|nr:relaxase/mobilization nuclease domain-containing protein [Clostridium sp. VAP23]
MAYVKQGTVKTTLYKVLNYITNPSKTDERILVTGINHCSSNPTLAYKQMLVTKEVYKKTDKVLGYHFKQAFKKGEIKDPIIAHEIGVKWAEKITEKKYECVVSTHVDKEHIHNHVVINSVSRETGEKYNSCKEQLRAIRKESDKLCQEYNLSIIKAKKYEKNEIENTNDYSNLSAVKNMSYNVWMIKNNIEDSRLTTMKYVTSKIDEIIANRDVNSLDELAEKLKEFKIETRYKSNKNELYKNISFKVIGSEQQKGFRGNYNHSIENLIKRINDPSIDEKRLNKNEWQKYANSHYPRANYKEFIKEAIDNTINSEKCNNIDDLANILKEKYNISMDYLNKDFRVKKRIKFFANDCPCEKYAVGSYGLAGKDNSKQYENDGIYERIERIKSKVNSINDKEKVSSENIIKKEEMIKVNDPTLIKFTNNLRQDFELLKAYFIYTNDTRKVTIQRCIDCLERANITDIDKLINLANTNAALAEKEIDEKNDILNKIKTIEIKEFDIESLNKKKDMLEDKIEELSSGLAGKIRNRNDIKICNEKINILDIQIKEMEKELLQYNKQVLIDKSIKLENSISGRKHLQENFKDTLNLYNNKENIAKESNKETTVKQADRLIEEVKKRLKENKNKFEK